MRYMSVKTLRPGIRMAKNVFTVSGAVIVLEGAVLDEQTIVNIKSSGISSVLIEDKRMDDIRIEELVSPEVRFDLFKKLDKMFNELENTIKALKSGAAPKVSIKDIIDFPGISAAMDRMISELDIITDFQNMSYEKEIILGETIRPDECLAVHSINTCILALAVGKSMRFGKPLQTILAQAALFHDLGMSMVPSELWKKNEKLRPEEYECIKEHPVLGHKLLVGSKINLHPNALTTILQHHENINGTGYPMRLKGNNLQIYAKILSICDVYSALLAHRGWRPAFMPHSAIEYILAGAGDIFDFETAKTFSQLIPNYPKGIMVELSSGEKGCIVSTNKGFVARPIVRVFTDKQGAPVQHRLEFNLALPEHQTKVIVKILEE